MVCQVCGGQHSNNQACAGSRAGGVAPSRPLLNHAEPPRGDPLLGTTLGSFRLIRKLGKGGMGTVYLGEQTLIGSKVAVKVLHGDLASDPQAVSRFQSEARAVNLIGHENIVSIFDMGVAGDTHYFVMEYLEGEPLTSLLQAPLEPQVAIPILTQVCDALSAAHEHGVVHRDLKPDNIFLVKRGKIDRFVKVLDFGVAKLLTAELQHTAHGMCVGTPTYMSPEQWLGQGVDGRSDIYALGILTYRLATGQLPFPRGGMLEMMTYHREKMPAPPRAVLSTVPESWSAAVMKALAKKPEERFQSATEFGQALRQVLRELDPSSVSTPRPVPTPSPAPRATQTPSPRPAGHTPPPMRHATPTPPPGQPPTPSARFRARIFSLAGAELFHADCTDLSRGGVFVCHDGELPPLFSRFNLRLELPEQLLECRCEVVRHVTPREAAAWRMSPGFGLQFIEVSPEFKASISQLLKIIRAPTPAEVLKHYETVEDSDLYRLLKIEPNATFSEVRRVAEKARSEVTALLAVPLPNEQREQAYKALERLAEAERTLGAEMPRVEYDARRQNFRGVAVCLDAGVAKTDVDSARERYLSSRPDADELARAHFAKGQQLERDGQAPEALREYEQGLHLDPLNMELQEHYWVLHRKVHAPGGPGPRPLAARDAAASAELP